MRRDFRGRTEGHEQEIVEGDLADIGSCDAVLAAFTSPDEGTSMEAWYAHDAGKRVVAYTGGRPRTRGRCTSRTRSPPTSRTRSRRSRAETEARERVEQPLDVLRVVVGRDRDA